MLSIKAYEALWDDVAKQLTRHADTRVIDQAVKTIRTLLASTSLGNTNKLKLDELQGLLVSSLRTLVVDKDVEASAFEEDELLALGACVARIDKLFAAVDISTTLDDVPEGEEPSALEVIDGLSARGRLGYRDEAVVRLFGFVFDMKKDLHSY